MDAAAHQRIAQARLRAARMPRVDDPLVVDLLCVGFTWDGPDPNLIELFSAHDRGRIDANLRELRARRNAEAERFGDQRFAAITPGAVLSAVYENWAGKRSDETAPATALTDAPATAHTPAPATAPAAAYRRTRASDSGIPRTSNTTTTVHRAARRGGGGGASIDPGLREELSAAGGMWHVGHVIALAAMDPDLVRCAIDLAKRTQAEKKTPDWGRFVRAKIESGHAEQALRERREADARAAIEHERRRAAADARATRQAEASAQATAVAAAIAEASDADLAAALADAAALPHVARFLRRWPRGEEDAGTWTRRMASHTSIRGEVAARLAGKAVAV